MAKETKELKNIRKAINKWIDKHKGKVQFIGSFAAFEGDDCEVIDDLIIGYGPKKGIEISLKELNSMIKKEKGFVNW